MAQLDVHRNSGRQQIVSIPIDQLGDKVGSLSDDSQLVVAALDELFTRAWQ
jgi:hypothetical protein